MPDYQCCKISDVVTASTQAAVRSFRTCPRKNTIIDFESPGRFVSIDYDILSCWLIAREITPLNPMAIIIRINAAIGTGRE
jgi:hypothetical protein